MAEHILLFQVMRCNSSNHNGKAEPCVKIDDVDQENLELL